MATAAPTPGMAPMITPPTEPTASASQRASKIRPETNASMPGPQKYVNMNARMASGRVS